MEKITYRGLSDGQKNFIKTKGMEVFSSIKNFVNPKTNKDINNWLVRHGLIVSVPNNSFIKENIDDITFAITKLPMSINKIKSLVNIRTLLEQQLVNPDEKKVLLFHEINGEEQEWSLVNMFDNNIILWLTLLNERLSKSEFKSQIINFPGYKEGYEKDLDFILKVYYDTGDSDSFAAHDLLRAILFERKKIFINIFSKTWGGGKEIENDFLSYVSSLGVNGNEFKNFSGEGNFVDRAGIDCAIKGISSKLIRVVDEVWTPVQVKPNQSEAFKAIPYKGISVYPYMDSFYFYENKEVPPRKIDELFL